MLVDPFFVPFARPPFGLKSMLLHLLVPQSLFLQSLIHLENLTKFLLDYIKFHSCYLSI
jgi:hypothetical protein